MDCINPLLTSTQSTSTAMINEKMFFSTKNAWKNCHYRGVDLLLQGSDDPLIGHGANSVLCDDDHPMELRTLQLQQQQQQQPIITNTTATLSTTTATAINWSDIVKEKLKNKTQAKVQQQQQLQQQEQEQLNMKLHLNKVKKEKITTATTTTISTGNKPAHENVKSWLKSIVDMQNNVTQQKQQHQKQPAIINVPEKKKERVLATEKHAINYNDLPYMGEITLDNSRPRRGRKPKKANICHLIYKNYGTIILGEPKISTCKNCNVHDNVKHQQQQQPEQSLLKVETLPLNLCLRDQQQQQQLNKTKDQSKNKRSTIFISPKTQESTNISNITSPSVEVSIGKFKFTGGVNPLLQKKKMLSVDSVGNYIYFDGNDNKMLHAAEQQKLPVQQQKTVDTLKYTTFPKCLNKLKEAPITPMENISSLNSARKRKITRRSEQRERLEKSFKEQGYLIQTQQMQSSEGATYCKFRQLKKFTRYLFRNWKDYLPNELQQQQQQQHQITTTATSAIFNKTEPESIENPK